MNSFKSSFERIGELQLKEKKRGTKGFVSQCASDRQMGIVRRRTRTEVKPGEGNGLETESEAEGEAQIGPNGEGDLGALRE